MVICIAPFQEARLGGALSPATAKDLHVRSL